MSGIVVGERELVGRPARVRSMLRSLGDGRDIGCSFVPGAADGQARAIAARDGESSGTNYRDWYFRTAATAVRGQYFELWYPRGARSWSLQRAYFNLFRINEATHSFDEMVSVHCDPLEVGDYKRGPHLHVKQSADPIPHAHFALNLSEVAEVLSSLGNLTEAMGRALKMVADEVVARCAAG